MPRYGWLCLDSTETLGSMLLQPAISNLANQGWKYLMTLKQLRFFSVDDLVILKYLTDLPSLTVTSIAEKMHLSQPAVSQRIRKMEDVLGEKLIERSGRGIKLTSFGVIHACRASEALNILDSI